MKITALIIALGLTIVSGSAMALPTADSKQTNHCRGVVAETKPTSAGGYFIVGTYLYLQIGPTGEKYWVDFFR
ncbi:MULTISPECIES: hypothetical protein [unclassified Pseudomonas]|uniref:hypothetical protein n=1 Tax=unclassified Pseudomonas TaxID=196821 RepID=UPI00381F8532